ncbi:hypothetical protein PAMP_005938 [Pampus punctatissimus]
MEPCIQTHGGQWKTSRVAACTEEDVAVLSVLESPSRLDEEHRLIARYAARLAAEAGNSTQQCPPTDLGFNFDANKQQRQLIAELENKNREILQEIQRLRLEHEQASQPTPEKAQQNPTLLTELRLLRLYTNILSSGNYFITVCGLCLEPGWTALIRSLSSWSIKSTAESADRLQIHRKDELERRMSALQESRRELMVQLEGLMRLLKDEEQKQAPKYRGPVPFIGTNNLLSNVTTVWLAICCLAQSHYQPYQSQRHTYPFSTKAVPSQSGGSPHSSPSHGAGCSMPMPIRSTSAGSTPTHTPQDCLAGVGGDVLEAFAQGVPRNLRNDLLVAADSITNTMSSLVKELHSVDDGAEEEETNMRNGGDRDEPLGAIDLMRKRRLHCFQISEPHPPAAHTFPLSPPLPLKSLQSAPQGFVL